MVKHSPKQKWGEGKSNTDLSYTSSSVSHCLTAEYAQISVLISRGFKQHLAQWGGCWGSSCRENSLCTHFQLYYHPFYNLETNIIWSNSLRIIIICFDSIEREQMCCIIEVMTVVLADEYLVSPLCQSEIYNGSRKEGGTNCSTNARSAHSWVECTWWKTIQKPGLMWAYIMEGPLYLRRKGFAEDIKQEVNY